MTLAEIDAAIKEVCPIHGVNSRGEIAFDDAATVGQKEVAQKLMNDLLSRLDERDK